MSVLKVRPTLASTLPILGFILLTLASMWFEKWRILQQQTRVLNLHVTEVNKQLERLLFFPRVLSTDPRFVSVFKSSDKSVIQQANALLERIRKLSGAAFVFIMDDKGFTLASSNANQPNSFIGRNYGFRPYFRKAISGKQATYYAVGATTSQPGYFIANPILDGSSVLGVIVVKIHLDSLEDSWNRLDYDIAVFDDFDVTILSNREDFLYVPYSTISAEQFSLIAEEKRYSLNRQADFVESDANEVEFSSGRNHGFLSVSQNVGPEPWKIRLLYPKSKYWSHILLYMTASLALMLIWYLLLRIFRQQKIIADVERRHAQQLEAKVAERTEQLKSAQQQLIIQSNYTMLGKMSAAINHEINQPLASLRFNLASLRQLLDQKPLQFDMVRQVATESDLTTKRISRVLETLRSVGKTTKAQFETVNLAKLLEDTVKIVRRERPNTSEYLYVRELDSEITVRGDYILLQQALLNLLSNAFDAVFQAELPEVILGLQYSEFAAQIFVSDNGAGVSQTMTSKIFDEYSTSKRGSQGLGLGLALSSQIAVDHGGRLRYDPEMPRGSRFTLELPLIGP